MASRPALTPIPRITAAALARNPHVRLSDPEAQASMAAIRQRIKEDPAFGRELLRKAGIINAKGKVTKAFGG